MIYSFTGHRPPKAQLSYAHTEEGDCIAMDRIRDFLEPRYVDYVIVGGALGFDTLAALTAYELHIPYKLFVPFVGQESIWPLYAQERYNLIKAAAMDVVICSPGGYTAHKMQVRNEAMVDASDHLIAYWDGSAGGTRNCMDYAVAWDVPISNIYLPPGV